MSQARTDFLDRLQALLSAIAEPALSVRPPSEVAHNSRARLLRNGLAVVGFSTLEDFLRKRTSEVLASLNGTTVRFIDLPEDIQTSTTIGAIRALTFQAGLRKRNGEDPVPYVQAAARSVASTATAAYSLCEISFGHERSNIGEQDVADTLKAFLVRDPWGQVTALAKRMGLGGTVSYKQEFTSAAAIRHTAAHAASSDVALLDLEGFAKKAVAIALSFDVLLTRCAYRLPALVPLPNPLPTMDATAIRFRFVDPSTSTTWREQIEGAKRATRVMADRDALFRAAVGRGKATRDVIVLRDARLFPVRWLPTDGL